VPDEQVDLTVREASSAAAAERLLEAEDVEAVLQVSADGPVVTGLRDVPDDLAGALADTYRLGQLQDALEQSGASEEQVAGLLSPAPVSERLLDDSALAPELTFLLNFVFSMLFFFVVFQFGYSIAQGVVTEKESRIVELLVSAVPIRTLLAGKVLGNGGLALVQIVLLALVAIVGTMVTGERELTELLLRNAGWFVLFFMLGFLDAVLPVGGGRSLRQPHRGPAGHHHPPQPAGHRAAVRVDLHPGRTAADSDVVLPADLPAGHAVPAGGRRRLSMGSRAVRPAAAGSRDRRGPSRRTALPQLTAAHIGPHHPAPGLERPEPRLALSGRAGCDRRR
jgi:hypothetical protein